MPTYQYTCTDCGEPIEAVQKFTDEPLTVCATCGGRLRKVFSPVGIVFKGSGFYRNDSRNGSGSAAAKEKTSSESSSATPGSSSSNGSADNDKKSEPAKKSESAKSSSASEKVA